MKLENLPNFVVFMTFTICFTVLYSPRLIAMLGGDTDLINQKISIVSVYWVPVMLNVFLMMYVQSLDLKIYSRAWIYQRIYSAGSISLMSISTAVTNFKIHSLSVISEGKTIPLSAYVLCGSMILLGIAWLVLSFKYQYGMYLSRKERERLMTPIHEEVYRSVGRFRVPEIDDVFECFRSN